MADEINKPVLPQGETPNLAPHDGGEVKAISVEEAKPKKARKPKRVSEDEGE